MVNNNTRSYAEGDADSESGITHPARTFTQIGSGEIGGKAQGLVRLEHILTDRFDKSGFSGIKVDIPWFWVITTDWFDQFMENNRLYDVALSDARDQHMANAFQRAKLPDELTDHLKNLISEVHVPLAVRSSSLLEDTLHEPFAGVYDTKMVPNNQFSADARMHTLVEAVKFVYASTFSGDAKSYREGVGRSHREEKMAVLIQEVVGLRHGDRYYPNISGVARSCNFYSLGCAKPEDGVVSLALGLGKTIVDGGRVWTYCPVYPKAKPPFGSIKELLTQTQIQFWCVNMGKPPSRDPLRETEYLFPGDLRHADQDDVLRELASTFDPQTERMSMGTATPGARVLNFSPILDLDEIPLNNLVRELLNICENDFENPVEIEFAANIPRVPSENVRLGLLQVRPMLVSEDIVEITESELGGDDVFIASEHVLGNGQRDDITDVVYVKPETFLAKDTWLIAAELDEINRQLLGTGRPYLLVVLGRLGTSDPWLGIPVNWGQVSGARVVVEASSTEMNVDMSQGSHFFHNVNCLGILYFSADKTGEYPVNWSWLANQNVIRDLRFVRHVSLDRPLSVKVDGNSCRGVICCERTDAVGN